MLVSSGLLTRVHLERQKARYTYPPESPSSPASPNTLHGAPERPVPIAHRLRALQAELASLEVELADPSNPRLHREREEDNVDPGELIRGLVDVRVRLEKISKGKEGRGKLVNVVIGNGEAEEGTLPVDGSEDVEKEKFHDAGTKDGKGKGKGEPLDVRSVVEMDKRVGELEKLVGSSSAALDEVRTTADILFFPSALLNGLERSRLCRRHSFQC